MPSRQRVLALCDDLVGTRGARETLAERRRRRPVEDDEKMREDGDGKIGVCAGAASTGEKERMDEMLLNKWKGDRGTGWRGRAKDWRKE